LYMKERRRRKHVAERVLYRDGVLEVIELLSDVFGPPTLGSMRGSGGERGRSITMRDGAFHATLGGDG